MRVLERRSEEQREIANQAEYRMRELSQQLAEVPDGPTIVVANEFFDAVPVNQAVKKGDTWHERVIEVDESNNLVFGIAPDPIPNFVITLPPSVRDAPNGAIFEWRSNTMTVDLCRRIVKGGGAALMIDYGHVASGSGETLQAIGRHAYADLLSTPGEVDLTAHVDFDALSRAFETMGVNVHGPIDLATFLRRLGIDRRAATLKSAIATPDKAKEVDAAAARLTAAGPTGMGTMFKVIAFSAPLWSWITATPRPMSVATRRLPGQRTPISFSSMVSRTPRMVLPGPAATRRSTSARATS